jgi:hypothetical protein
MMNLPITKEWIISPFARRLYMLTSLFSLAFSVFLIAMKAIGSQAASDITKSVPMFLILRMVTFVGVLTTAITWVSMLYFWFEFDKSGSVKKAVWFVVLMIAAPACPFYCLTTYRHSQVSMPDEPSGA